MEFPNTLESTLHEGNLRNVLFKGSSEKEVITDLQRILFELGFRKELKWDNYQADGSYGPATSKAVAAFAQKNGIKTNGEMVTKKLAKIILQRHDFLPEMYLLWTIYKSDLRTKLYISKGTKLSIIAIQTMLNELGYGSIMKFSKFGADGIYGKNSRKAFIQYAADRNISTDGDWLKRDLVNQMIKDINQFYGKNWSDQVENNMPQKGSPLVIYEGSRFRGKPCRVHKEFVPSLKKMDAFAEAADVFIYITSSFRTSTNVKGAIVTPSKRSNHLAGHAIDMNIIYDNNKWARSTMMKKHPNVPAPVRQFLQSVIDDPGLRWGGNFSVSDSVHIDDGLNRREPKKWERRYKALQKAVQLGLV